MFSLRSSSVQLSLVEVHIPLVFKFIQASCDSKASFKAPERIGGPILVVPFL
jgi:hypothetical protein